MTPKRKLDTNDDPQEQEAPNPNNGGVLNANLTFDNLFDGLNYDPAIDAIEDLDEYRRAWQLRRDLAELSLRPEGFFFTWRASDHRVYGAPLITPPDLEAVQRVNGTWFRSRRLLGRNNVAPYSEQWYSEYLHHFGLPTYFLRRGHLAMMHEDFEAERLGMFNAPSPQYATVPRSDYLTYRYNATPYWPRPNLNGIYRIELQSEGARASLSRHYPAVSITVFPCRIYIWPNGQVQLHSTGQAGRFDPPIRAESDIEWDGFEEGQRVLSSYHREMTGFHPSSHPTTPREDLMQRAVDQHAIINPLEESPGQGRLTFLSHFDQQAAVDRGFVNTQGHPDPSLVNRARIRGELAVGTGVNAGPITVFWPDLALRNPVVDPEGPGAWRFLTTDGLTSNRGLASINFGGSHGLPNHPTASQIRRLGQLFIQDGRENLADMIDIIWAPGEVEDDPGVDPVLDAAVETDDDEVNPTRAGDRGLSHATLSVMRTSSPPTDHGVAAAASGVEPNEDPTNGNPGGEYDQTGGSWAEYRTVFTRGRNVTIDRSRAWQGKEEPHKFWCYSARGWKKWSHWKDMDWEDKKKVSDLNKHREQTHQRAKIWERKRAEPREDYTQEELEYVMGLVSNAGGERPDEPLAVIAGEFNRRFSAHRRRNDAGIQSLIDRLRKEYQEFGGLRRRKGRGWKQQEASKGLRGASSNLEPREDKESDGGSEWTAEDGEGEDEE